MQQRGSSLIEVVTTLALAGIVTAMSASSLTSLLHRRELRAAAAHVRGLLAVTNVTAQVRGRYRAIRFTQADGTWAYSIYEDGNDNGVSIDEVARGIDVRIAGPIPLIPPGVHASVDFPEPRPPDPDTRDPIAGSPVQFGSSAMCSFSPSGTCTPGTLFLTDGDKLAAMVRCSGSGSNLTVAFYGMTRAAWTD